jgi:hypothetical protein
VSIIVCCWVLSCNVKTFNVILSVAFKGLK